MDPTALAPTAWQVIVDTALYLLAYRGAPLAAVVVAALLAGWAPADRLRARAVSGGGLTRVLAVAALGCIRPLGRRALRRDLGALRHRGDVVVYLTTGHGLTVYYLLLTGPLLGKDVLLSHLVGGAIFAAAAAAGVRYIDPGAEVESLETVGPARPNGLRRALAEMGRALGLMALGLVLGGLIGAWGLMRPSGPAPVEVVAAPWLAQLLNALLAVAASALLWMWPVENLFVGTYLWKTGLAHAGLVAFFWASPVSPQRLRLYRQLWGARIAWRLGAVLAAAAVVAGMATALLYRVTPLAINYKLIPAQMW